MTDDKQRIAREEFFCRGGIAGGIPLGALVYQAAGWIGVALAGGLAVVVAIVGYLIALLRG